MSGGIDYTMFENVELPEDWDTSAYSMQGEETEAPYTQTITRFGGKMVNRTYVGEMAEFEVLLGGQLYDGRAQLAQPSLWTTFTRRDYKKGDGSPGLNASGSFMNTRWDPIEVDLGKGMVPVLGLMYASSKRQREAEGNQEPYSPQKFVSELRGQGIYFNRGMAFFWQQRGASADGYTRAEQLFTKPNEKRGYDPTGLFDLVKRDPKRNWRNMTKNLQVDMSSAMEVYALHVGQEDPAWANPPGRPQFHDIIQARLEGYTWWLWRRAERRKIRAELREAAADSRAKLNARLEQLNYELRFFNLAGVDEIHVETDETEEFEDPATQQTLTRKKTIEMPNGNRVTLRVKSDRWQSGEAPVGHFTTQLGDVVLYQKNRRSGLYDPGVTTNPEDDEVAPEDIVDEDSDALDETVNDDENDDAADEDVDDSDRSEIEDEEPF